MPKKASRTIERIGVPTVIQQQASKVGEKIEELADDLGHLLGLARDKAEGWMGQRQTVSAHLAEIRDTAAELLTRIVGDAAGESSSRTQSPRRGKPRAKARLGRQRLAAAGEHPGAAAAAPKKRTMSPEARRAISEAQKARWARQRRAGKTGG